MPRRQPLSVLGTAALLVALAGCAASTPPAGDAATPTAAATTGAVLPEPGRTIDATPPAADATLAGYRIAVVEVPAGTAAPTRAGADAFAAATGAGIDVYSAASDAESDIAAALADAVATGPDLVVGLGADVVDTFSFDTAQLLDQQFLVVGAQLAEPTANVTAVIWDGATSRGSAVAPDAELADAAVSADLVEQAIAVGVESVRGGVTGVVLDLPVEG